MNTVLLSIVTTGLLACGSSAPRTAPAAGATPADTSTVPSESGDTAAGQSDRKPGEAGKFEVKDTDESSRAKQGKLKPTASEAAVRFFVVDKENQPIEGIAIALSGPDGKKYYTEETDAQGFAEVLLPIGQTYGVVYLSLGKRDVSAKVDVANKPNLNLKLTLRYKTEDYPTALVLENVEFPSGSATLIGDSSLRLDSVVEYLTHKKSVNVEISGHTDNVGNKKANTVLSQKRAEACRAYLISKGIDGARVKAIGYGDAKPIAPNTTPEGRQKNRRIEAAELKASPAG